MNRWVLDADIRDFFDSIDHDWVLKFVEHKDSGHEDAAPHPKVVERWDGGEGPLDEEHRWDATGSSRVAPTGEHLPALRL